MFRAGVIAEAAMLLIAATTIPSKPVEVGVKQATVGHTNAQGTQNTSPEALNLFPSQWPLQPQQYSQTYQFNYYPQQQADEGADAFLGISSGLWVAIFTLALVLATFVQACLILRAESLTRAALKITQRQAVRAKIDAQKRTAETATALEIAKKSADAAVTAQRPWVSVNVAFAGDLILDKPMCRLPLAITVKNVGNSPANEIRVWNGLVPEGIGGSPTSRLEDAVNAAKQVSERMKKIKMGYSLFPDSEDTNNYMVQFEATEINKAVQSSTLGPMIILQLAVIVDYRFAGDEGQTISAFTVWGLDQSTGGFGHLDSSQPSVPRWMLRLQKMPIWDFAA